MNDRLTYSLRAGLKWLRRHPMEWLRRRPMAVALLVVALLLGVGLLAGVLFPPPADDEESGPASNDEVSRNARSDFRLEAVAGDAIGIETDTAFLLTSERDLATDAIRGMLRIAPEVEMQITKAGVGRYTVSPIESLSSGTLYRFTIEDGSQAPASWAFQTKNPIQIVQTLPRNQGTQVPLNTGIELTFSHDGVAGIEDHWQISPPVQGRFELHKRVVVFVPENLQPDTLYTVTITSGIGVRGTDDVMAEDKVFQFETGGAERTGFVDYGPALDFTRKVNEAGTQETPAFEIYRTNAEPGPVTIAAYRYPTLLHFLDALQQYQNIPTWAYVTRNRYVAPTDDLILQTTFQTELRELGFYGRRYATFPDTLPEGFYLIEASIDDGPSAQSWLQVTDVASYVAVSSTETLAWINDLATEQPLVGARVEFLGTGVSMETDAEGIARVTTPDALVSRELTDDSYVRTETVGNILVSAPDGRAAIIPLAGVVGDYSYYYYYGYGYSSSHNEYWHYLSMDRPLYRPSDSVRFWGVARPREGVPSAETVTVRMTGYSTLDYYYRPVTIAETEVPLSAIGTYNGELAFDGLSPGYYRLTVLIDGFPIDSQGVSVQRFTKPSYTITVTPDRVAALVGEQIEFIIEAAFLEGTPVPGLALNYYGYGQDRGELTTDERGRASVTITARTESGYWPSSNFIRVTPARAEEAEISGEAWVSVYPASLYIDTDARIEGESGVIEGTVHHVDLSRINGGTSSSRDDFLGAPAAGEEVSIQITQVEWERHETGEYYDFIAKLVRKQYDYTRIETPLGEFTATTDASGRFSYTFALDPTRIYDINVSVQDEAGRSMTNTPRLSGRFSRFNVQSNSVFLTLAESDPTPYYGGVSSFELGDDVVLEMRRGADVLPEGGVNRYLFYHGQRGLRQSLIQDSPLLSFTFGEEHIPNTSVQGIWFNGRTYIETRYPYQLRFDPSARRLNIEITPDQERYRPGDTATLALRVTDADGAPQPDTEINVAVVDEAIFLLQGSYSYTREILEALYAPVGSGIHRTYASHQYPLGESGAERGGDSGVREDFADLAFFGQVTTDGQGRASVTFQLPDNLTSWRITTQAFNSDLKAGTASRSIPVGLPFFIEVTANGEYLVSDKPFISVRSYGRDLQPGVEVTFELTAPSLGIDDPVRVSAPAFQAAQIPLPDLATGEHELLIAGSADGMEDALIRTITVVPSRLLQGEARFYELAAGLEIEGSADGYTTVVFSDHERGRYLNTLRRLSWGYGDRVDQLLARDLAADLLTQHFEQIEARGEDFDASAYVTQDGGVSLLPYSDSELALSARVAALAPERFGRTGLMNYFMQVAQDRDATRERQIIALYGLAALGEPVLVPLQTALEETDLSWRERLYLGLAAQELGDDPTAQTVLDELVRDFGESRAPYYRLRVGVDQDDILEATSLAAVLAAGVADELAPDLLGYTAANRTTDLLIELEQISFLAQALPRLSAEPVRFAYELAGERHEIDLASGRSHTLRLSRDELSSIILEQITGRVGVASWFQSPLDPARIGRDSDISIERSYQVADLNYRTLVPDFETLGAGNAIDEGQFVRIQLTFEFSPQAIDGCYQVTDLLPSGLRPITRNSFGRISPYHVDGQRVSFCVSPRLERQTEYVSYWARVVNAGEFTAEPATIQSAKSRESMNFSDAIQVVIR